MGVPVVTLVGNRHAARVGYSLLSQLSEDRWIANNPNEYLRIACHEAADMDALVQERLGRRFSNALFILV